MRASHSSFVACKNAICSQRGGLLELSHSTFERNDTALSLDEAVRGHAFGNAFDGTAFGRFHKPPRFLTADNTTGDSDSESD